MPAADNQVPGRWNDSWPTPIYQVQVPDAESLNRELLADIGSGTDGKPSTSLGMLRGRKSDFTLLNSESTSVKALQIAIFTAADTLNRWVLGDQADRLADQVADGMVAEAWSVVYGNDGYHGLHVHHGSAWSGVYYVSTTQMREGSGQIQLLDPRVAAVSRANTDRDHTHAITPRAGMLIAFPSWLYHWVTPVASPTLRICVAFNVGFSAYDGDLIPATGAGR